MKVALIVLGVIALVALALGFYAANVMFEMMLTRTALRKKKENKSQRQRTPEEEAVYQDWHTRREALLAAPHDIWHLTSKDGLKLHARCIPAEKPTDRWALCVHGYTATGPNEYAWFFDFYRRLGFNLLLPDNRAHGESEGEYVGMGVLDSRDIRLWMDELVRRTDGNCRIVLHGVSMGAATVTTINGRETPSQVRGVLADCGFTSVWDEFAHEMRAMFHLPAFPLLHLAGVVCKLRAGYGLHEFSPLDAVKQAKKPMLFVHGAQDDFVPTRMGKALYEACVAEKSLLLVEGAAHAVSYRTNPQAYEQAAMNFFESIGMGE